MGSAITEVWRITLKKDKNALSVIGDNAFCFLFNPSFPL